VEVEEPPPLLQIKMSQSAYFEGDIVTASEFRLTNPGSQPRAVELSLWLTPAGGSALLIARVGSDSSFVLPPGFRQEFGPLSLFSAEAGMPVGTYQFSSQIRDPLTGGLYSEDINSFGIGALPVIQVESISPQSVSILRTSAPLEVAVYGVGFEEDRVPQVTVEDTGVGTALNLMSTTFISRTELRAKINQIQRYAGTYAIAVKEQFNDSKNPRIVSNSVDLKVAGNIVAPTIYYYTLQTDRYYGPTVRIVGSGFTYTLRVTLNDRYLRVVSGAASCNSDTGCDGYQLDAQLPQGATAGSLRVIRGGIASNAVAFALQ